MVSVMPRRLSTLVEALRERATRAGPVGARPRNKGGGGPAWPGSEVAGSGLKVAGSSVGMTATGQRAASSTNRQSDRERRVLASIFVRGREAEGLMEADGGWAP